MGIRWIPLAIAQVLLGWAAYMIGESFGYKRGVTKGRRATRAAIAAMLEYGFSPEDICNYYAKGEMK